MYLKKIFIENYGPIEKFDLDMPFDDENGNPKPVVIVGENGSGKSLILSHIVNVLILQKQEVYKNTEVDKGKVYKLMAPSYIKNPHKYYYSKIEFRDKLKPAEEIQLGFPKKDFPKPYPDHLKAIIGKMGNDDTARPPEPIGSKEKIKEFINKNSLLYFPPNRFEEPAWLNEKNLSFKPEIKEQKRLTSHSDRRIICNRPLKDNINWLFDVLFQQVVGEKIPIFNNQSQPAITYDGPCTVLINQIFKFIHEIMSINISDNPLHFHINHIKNRSLSLQGKDFYLRNLFQLSSGETSLLNIFLSILRDYTFTENNTLDLENITGIVIIDEIDKHLHTNMQCSILPLLIKKFPKVQFIITTHSPLFLLGMEKEFGDTNFQIVEASTGNKIGAEEFSEYKEIFSQIQQTKEFEKLLMESNIPILIVEGKNDVGYIKAAAKKSGKKELIDKIEITDAEGFGGLDKCWNFFTEKLNDALNHKIFMLYDCDKEHEHEFKGNFQRKSIDKIDDNPIKTGIENLFSKKTVEKIKNKDEHFIIPKESNKNKNGKEEKISDNFIICCNKKIDIKREICNWLCENGTEEDFENFEQIFDLIKKYLLSDNTQQPEQQTQETPD